MAAFRKLSDQVALAAHGRGLVFVPVNTRACKAIAGKTAHELGRA
jgi:hypothetical protein